MKKILVCWHLQHNFIWYLIGDKYWIEHHKFLR